MKPLCLLLLAFICAADCPAQSVADIARRERERQRTAQSKILITSGRTTLTSTATPSADSTVTPSAGAQAPVTATPTAVKPGEPVDSQGRNESYWRAAFQKARDDAKRAEAKADVLDLKLKDLNTQILRQSDVFNRENRIGPEITATQKELDNARQEAEQARKRISDLEETLRKSGGPAGWAR